MTLKLIKKKSKESVKIIEQIWKVANQKTRDSVCYCAIDSFQDCQRKTDLNGIPALKTVIQEMEEHKRVMDLGCELRGAIKELDVERVKELLVDCGEDVESVLTRNVYWNSGRVDAFLVYPLLVLLNENLNQENMEKRKEIFELMLGYASPWLCRFEIRKEDGAPYVNYVIDRLALAQKHFATVPGVGKEYFQDLIQEFEEKLSKNELDNAKTDYQIAWDKEYATRFSQEINHDLFENDGFIDDTDLGQDTVNSAPTAGNKTPEKNDTTFLSKHKGKIALGVTGLCVAGAVAAYVLAYPVVALALAVLAAVILMGAGIAKVCEKVKNPSVDKVFDKNEQLLNQ